MTLAEYQARKATLDAALVDIQAEIGDLSKRRMALKVAAREVAAKRASVLGEVAVVERAIANLTNPERPPAQMLGARVKE